MRKVKSSVGDKVFDMLNLTLLLIFTLICIFPFYYVLINSISSAKYVDTQQVFFWPRGIQFDTYKEIFKLDRIGEALGVSIARTVLGTLATVIGAAIPGYIITKKELPVRKFWYRYMVITMYFSAGIIPTYLNMKMLRLTNNFLVYVIPGFVTPFNMILVKTYIESLPASLEEAAMIDGAGFYIRFTKIVVPLIKPIIATVAVFGAVGQWNSYMDTVLYMSGNHFPTLQSILYQFLNQSKVLQKMLMQGNADKAASLMNNMSTRTTRFAITGVTVLPILFVYPFFQRYFTKGIMIGAVKG